MNCVTMDINNFECCLHSHSQLIIQNGMFVGLRNKYDKPHIRTILKIVNILTGCLEMCVTTPFNEKYQTLPLRMSDIFQ